MDTVRSLVAAQAVRAAGAGGGFLPLAELAPRTAHEQPHHEAGRRAAQGAAADGRTLHGRDHAEHGHDGAAGKGPGRPRRVPVATHSAPKDNAMNNANAIHNRFMRLAMYVHKRQHGATVVVRRKVQVQADPKTGADAMADQAWKVPRVVVLPEKTSTGGAAERRGDGRQPGDHSRLQLRHRRPPLPLRPPRGAARPGAGEGRLDRLQQPPLRHREHRGLRVRHGLAGDRQGTERARRSLRHADDPRLHGRPACAARQLPSRTHRCSRWPSIRIGHGGRLRPWRRF